jgi:hypothetical protein
MCLFFLIAIDRSDDATIERVVADDGQIDIDDVDDDKRRRVTARFRSVDADKVQRAIIGHRIDVDVASECVDDVQCERQSTLATNSNVDRRQ